jgi:hypothetical protein
MEYSKCVIILKDEELHNIVITTQANGYRWRRNLSSVKQNYSDFFLRGRHY